MIDLIILLPSFSFLIGASFITGLQKALQVVGRIQSKKEFKQKPQVYFAFSFVKRLFSTDPWDNFFYLISFTKSLAVIIYATSFVSSLLLLFFKEEKIDSVFQFFNWANILLSISIVSTIGLLFDFLFTFIASLKPINFMRFSAPIISCFLFLFSPITFLFLKLQKGICPSRHDHPNKLKTAQIKNKILEIVHESTLSKYLEPFDRKIISSVASIRDRIVREIMVPRINMFSLSIDQTIHEAAKKFITQRYSRIPIYKGNMDNIVGLLLYKDVMEYYFESFENQNQSPLKTPLEKLVKPVIYTPETKKISLLLQEFSNQQIHLAIVVDEYGSTEGIITTEDILEELVGEITDEHDDVEEEQMYKPHKKGGWVIEGKMTILDIEKKLNIEIPKSPEYDTIGGYVFHRAGTIPSQGWKIHNDKFDLEVLISNERSIEKVLIVPSES